MHRPACHSIALLLLCIGLAAPVAAAEPPPLWAYFKNPMLSGARISPSGQHIAAKLSKQGMEMILVWNVATNSKTPILKFPGANYQIRWVDWANDERLIFGMQFREAIGGAGFLATHLYAVDRDGENLQQLSRRWEHAGRTPVHDSVASLFDSERKRILVNWQGRIISVDVENGRDKNYHPRMQRLGGWMLDSQDRVRGGWKGRRGTRDRAFYARVEDRGPFTRLRNDTWLEGPHFRPQAFDHENPKLLYVLSDHETGRLALYRYDIEQNRFLEKLFEHPRYDVAGVLEDLDERVVGAWYVADTLERHFFDAADGKLQNAIDRALPGARNSLVDWSWDEQRLIVTSSGAEKAPATYLYLPGEGQLIELFRAYPDLTDDLLAPVKRITVTARDGLKLRAYVTLPRGTAPKSLPLVTLVHGGPASRDMVRYNSWTQFLASRGYAVLQVNFRGSMGYGWDFTAKGFHQWGLEMQNDVTDAVQLLIDKGVADPQRVAIFGGSYGGYAAYMGLVREPEMFRCGASYGGVSDLHRMIDDDAWFFDGEVYTSQAIGEEVRDRKKLSRTSPVNLAARITRPVLVAHSRDAQRVPVAHSEAMIEALEKAGAPHETLILEHGMHHLNVERERIKFFQTLEDFLAGCTAPVAEAS